MEKRFTHFNKAGNAVMVDVSEKSNTSRKAIAKGNIKMNKETLDLISEGKIGKGDVLGVARVAAIMGSKRAQDIIPMCHTLIITNCQVDFEIDYKNNCIQIEAIVKTTGKTGVEMEALTSVSIAALTIYDMCKAVDKSMIIENIYLTQKSGGKSGDYVRHVL
ncbi:cyclic pyranopterin monophosphate synthase MoaC [Clostridium sp. YIM B02551]|uniref:cyclic pyranopterin monophosphate synthase MoaC n=1 Tax=Clostridium sp. YIM B02551 TaxID=2910679 RepID=UPI001EECA68D|nr:cyclic pyranopterin monophosphate synthase MoaC [Clostridium sp. YIM B02551]